MELWIRPERAGYGYTIEWTTLVFDHEDQEWQPRGADTSEDATDRRSLWDAARQLLTRLRAYVIGRMPTFEVGRTTVNVFALGDTYLFKHYFEQDEVFDALRPYYNEDEYRFEVPVDAFAEVEDLLVAHYYEPTVIDEPEQFCVVYPKYTEHPAVLFKASVLQRSTDDAHVFLMKDQLSVEQAVEQGATRLRNMDVDIPF